MCIHVYDDDNDDNELWSKVRSACDIYWHEHTHIYSACLFSKLPIRLETYTRAHIQIDKNAYIYVFYFFICMCAYIHIRFVYTAIYAYLYICLCSCECMRAKTHAVLDLRHVCSSGSRRLLLSNNYSICVSGTYVYVNI